MTSSAECLPIYVTSRSDLAEIRSEAATGLRRGCRVNVFVEAPGEKALIFSAFPRGRRFMLITANGVGQGLKATLNEAVEAGMRNVPLAFNQGAPL